MKDTKIISAFLGMGKSHTTNTHPELIISDSDIMNFSWSGDPKDKIRNPDFPSNYIKHIQSLVGIADIIFVSSHAVVRDALVAAGLEFYLVYPELSCKEECIQRYKQRGSTEGFIKLVEANFETWVNECSEQKGCTHIVLKPGQYISDILEIQD